MELKPSSGTISVVTTSVECVSNIAVKLNIYGKGFLSGGINLSNKKNTDIKQ